MVKPSSPNYFTDAKNAYSKLAHPSPLTEYDIRDNRIGYLHTCYDYYGHIMILWSRHMLSHSLMQLENWLNMDVQIQWRNQIHWKSYMELNSEESFTTIPEWKWRTSSFYTNSHPIFLVHRRALSPMNSNVGYFWEFLGVNWAQFHTFSE